MHVPPAMHTSCHACHPCHILSCTLPPTMHATPTMHNLCHAHPPCTPPSSSGQNDGHTLLKILPCPKLRLRVVVNNGLIGKGSPSIWKVACANWPICTDPGYLPPATKLRQGNVFTPVCQSFCSRGGVCHTHPGRQPPRQSPPGQTLPAQCMLEYTNLPVHDGIQVGGTYPTGMHSCL